MRKRSNIVSTQERKVARSGWSMAPLWIGIAFTVALLSIAVAQLAEHGSWLPLETNRVPASIGETGDFIGGWANSLALIWLIVVAWLQFVALRIQQQELEDTREELRRQALAATQQADTAEGMLKAERRRVVIEHALRARALLKELTIDGIKIKIGLGTSNDLPKYTLIALVRNLSDIIAHELSDSSSQKMNPNELQRLAEHSFEITDLIDEVWTVLQWTGEGEFRSSFLRWRFYADLYDNCKLLQKHCGLIDDVESLDFTLTKSL